MEIVLTRIVLPLRPLRQMPMVMASVTVPIIVHQCLMQIRRIRMQMVMGMLVITMMTVTRSQMGAITARWQPTRSK